MMMGQTLGVTLFPFIPKSTTAGAAAATSQSVTVGKFNCARVACSDQAIYVKLTLGAGTAVAGAADNILIPAGGIEMFAMAGDYDTLSLIEDAASAKWTVTIF